MPEAKVDKTEKRKIRLLAKEVLTKSKAKRLFYVCKPKEVVCGEEYVLGLVILNDDTITFNGGRIEITLFFPYGSGRMTYHLKQVIPLIPPKQSKTIWFEPQAAELSGTGMISIQKIVAIGEDIIVECYNMHGDSMLDTTRVLAFQVASREEIYQKYSVGVALFFSIIAMTVAIINAIASIINLLV